ncbi:hypothetical protein N7495_008579 [Penicillium taxi]|uniref:uncharacterized protein n=1 Tax=Penicillium taxi TaxID=168475 RepID=UPI0025452F05|nr:uncharacterized protein N7495_008579 [Penicillium taxi]KAJ5888538.1 hypothetical protein N7495_008579 [Penicillium taxi]
MEDPTDTEGRHDKITLTLHEISSEYSGSFGPRIINLFGIDNVAIGRASKRGGKDRMPAAHNAWFDCRVMSRDHAMVGIRQAGFKSPVPVLYDTDSTHGTWLNGRKLAPGEIVELSNDDVVKFGVDIQRGEDQFFALSARCTIEEGRNAPVVNDVPIIRSTSTNTFCVPDDSDIEDDPDQTISLPNSRAMDMSTDGDYRLPTGLLDTIVSFEQLAQGPIDKTEERSIGLDESNNHSIKDISSSEEDSEEAELYREDYLTEAVQQHLGLVDTFASAIGSEDESEDDAWSLSSGASSDNDTNISHSDWDSDSGSDVVDDTDVNPEEVIKISSIDPRLLMSQHNGRAHAHHQSEPFEINHPEIPKNQMTSTPELAPMTDRMVQKDSPDSSLPSSVAGSMVLAQKVSPDSHLPSPTKSDPYYDGPFSRKDLPRDAVVDFHDFCLSLPTPPMSVQKRKASEMDCAEMTETLDLTSEETGSLSPIFSEQTQSQLVEVERPVKRAKFSRVAFDRIAKVAIAGTEAAATARPYAIGAVVGTITTIATLAALPAGLFE